MDQLQLASLGGNAFTGVLPAAWGMNGAFPLLVSLDINGSSLTGERTCNAREAAILRRKPVPALSRFCTGLKPALLNCSEVDARCIVVDFKLISRF